jgi:hypothetical protein
MRVFESVKRRTEAEIEASEVKINELIGLDRTTMVNE